MTYKQIWTVRELLTENYSVSKWCPKCQQSLPNLDLAGLVAAGYGDKPPRELKLKCPTCKTRIETRIHPPKSGGPVGPPSR